MGRPSVLRRAVPCALILAACAGDADPVTETVVRIDAQPCARAAAAQLRVRVLDAEGQVARQQTEPVAGLSFPVQIPVLPRGGDASRAFWVEATFLDEGGAEVGSVRVTGAYVAGRISETGACLTDGCIGIDCGACTPLGGDAAIPACESCDESAGMRACAALEPALVPFGTGGAVCPGGSSACGPADGGMPDGGEPDGGADGGPPPDSGSCDGPEVCDNARDDDCDGRTDCFDDGCGGDAYCAQRQCNPGFPQFRWCSGVCVNTNQPANCGGCGIVCTSTACRTDIGDGRPRCGCASADDCPDTANCNLTYHACGCNAGMCGPNASCTPGGSFPAYCDFRVD